MRIGLLLSALVGCALLSACGATAPSSLEFVDISPAAPRLGEITTVRFRAIDSRGLPQAGAQVSFKLQSDKPGVLLSPLAGATNKGDGIVATQLTATGHVSSVVVVADSVDKTASSPPISFAGSAPNARQFTFQCGELAGDGSGGVHAIGAFDDTRTLIAGVKVDCIAHVGDRNGDGVPGALVSFLTEAGTIGPTETSLSDVIGNAKILYKTSYPLPQDVQPGAFTLAPTWDTSHTGGATAETDKLGQLVAPLWMHPFLWIQNPITQYGTAPNGQEPRRADPIRTGLTLNPRDNLVTMIAVTIGEEGYDDVNNNGKYDNGEPFDDLTEPFVDDNDNGTWDSDERWVDANGNGKWDIKNGVYDASSLIWSQERIIWTGVPNFPKDVTGAEPVMRVIRPTGAIAIAHLGGVGATILVSDPWFNSMAQNKESDGCTAAEGSAVVMFPKTVNGGRLLSYPSPTVVDFVLEDAHDKLANPPVPPYVPPVDFTTSISCEFTISPIQGATIGVGLPRFGGTVQ